MGLFEAFGDGVSIGPGGLSRPAHHKHHSSRSGHKKRSKSGSRSRSRTRSESFVGSFLGGGDSHSYHKHNSSRSSFFGLGNHSNHSRSGFFGLSRPSYYKRSPRQGFLQRTYKQLKRLLRDLLHFAKRHPWRVFFLVIMPLITGGALTALLARFGLRMPPTLERMIGAASRAASGDSIGLVGDAVGMASEFGGFSSGWGSKRGSNDMGGALKGMAKMFI